jgi:crotonobetainyl-CoA:carnitine CoA-transferase CaiB-like acyl-CoA transferase
MITLQGLNVSAKLLLGQDMPRESRVKTDNPLWNRYECKDGRWVCLAHMQSDRFWPSFCEALGIKDLEKDPRFDNMDKRAQNCQELIAILDKTFATKTYDEWDKVFQEKGDFIYTKVQSVADLPSDPQVIENDYIVPFKHPVLGDIKMVGSPINYSKTPASIRMPAPEFGEHTEQVLNEICGYSWEEIGQLREEEVI